MAWPRHAADHTIVRVQCLGRNTPGGTTSGSNGPDAAVSFFSKAQALALELEFCNDVEWIRRC